MPEIKHNFTGGKMNKDLDERLVPNGQYRDAMNIQVSTSEGSEIGTVQNLLSNHKMSNGPIFQTSNTTCIGSIADEKNDTLYWLNTDGSLPMKFHKIPNLVGAYDNYHFQTEIQGDYIHQYKLGAVDHVCVDVKRFMCWASWLEGPPGWWNIGTFVNTVYVSEDSGMNITVGMELESVVNYTPPTSGTNFTAGASTLFDGIFVTNVYSVVQAGVTLTAIVLSGVTAPLTSLIEAGPIINGHWEPFAFVFKNHNNFLNFSPNNIITGINIIDDMLFWTDGFNEPKKINIPRCLEGTHSSGLLPTRLINNTRGIDYDTDILLEEKHVTVIRKSPTEPLALTLKGGRQESTTSFIDDTWGGILVSGMYTQSFPDVKTAIITTTSDPFPSLPDAANDDVIAINGVAVYDFSGLQVGDIIELWIDEDINGNTEFCLDWGHSPGYGQKIVLKEFNENNTVAPTIPISDYRIKGKLISDGMYNSNGLTFYSDSASGQDMFSSTAAQFKIKVEIEVTSVSGSIPPVGITENKRKYAIDLFEEEDNLFEFKFPRFAYRYKYEDGEYSSFSPFTEIAFLPGSFDYHPKKGYNLGMTNRLTSVIVKNFRPDDIPLDVVSIDILYKEDASPNIYVVDTLEANEEQTIPNLPVIFGFTSPIAPITTANYNHFQTNYYEITEETIKSILPSNQLLRPWDNVPRLAKTQEVTGSRIVYANYLQNFDINASERDANFYPQFDHSLKSIDSQNQTQAVKSIKSLREYQLGVLFVDKYGRETPVISNKSGAFKIEKKLGKHANSLKVGFTGNPPAVGDELRYYKFFIKETSGEYYNMALDRWYDAEDGNVWLAFPSSDRNKIDIDTFLILKKGVDSNEAVIEKGRYKILAIENEAPDFVKTRKIKIDTKLHSTTPPSVFNVGSSGVPLPGRDSFEMNYEPFSISTSSDLHKRNSLAEGDLHVDFSISGTDQFSKRYKVAKITSDIEDDQANVSTAKYQVQIEGVFGEDLYFITDDPSGNNITALEDLTEINIYKHKVENKAQFDGRFFVKIFVDDTFNNHIQGSLGGDSDDYIVVDQKRIFYLMGNEAHRASHSREHTGHGNTVNSNQLNGGTGDYPNAYDNDFGFYACYFRNYNYGLDSGGQNGAYFFQTPGETNLGFHEFRTYTGAEQSYPGTDTYPHSTVGYMHGASTYLDDKVDDKHFEQVWYISGRNNKGSRTLSPDLYWGDFETSFTSGPPWISTFSDSIDQQSNWDTTGDSTPFDYPNANECSMTIAMGGIYTETNWNHLPDVQEGGPFHAPNLTGTPPPIPTADNFWAIGEDGGNPNYDDLGTVDWVSRLNPGMRFKWREDPNNTVHQISSGVSYHHKICYETFLKEASAGGQYVSPYPGWNGPNHGSGLYEPTGNTFTGGNPTWTNHGGSCNGAQLSPNFSKEWTLPLSTNMSQTWSPIGDDGITSGSGTGSLGPIANGLEVPLTTVSGTVSFNDNGDVDDHYIIVTSAVGTDPNFGSIRIQPGMMLTSYIRNSDSGTENLQAAIPTDGSSSGGDYPMLLVRDVDTVSDTETKIYLQGYIEPIVGEDGGGSTRLWTIPSTNHPDRSAKRIKSSSTVTFKQPAMNGYSDFSANRISMNHSIVYGFVSSPTTSLLGAVGYTLEFIEDLEPESTLPQNPAIFETEPKENTELDIYYEMSGLIPFELNEQTTAMMIPTVMSVENPYGSVQNCTLRVRNWDYEILDWEMDDSRVLLYPSSPIPSNLPGPAPQPPTAPTTATITRPDGSYFTIRVIGISPDGEALCSPDMWGQHTQIGLNWHNCYSFGNGVESNRIRDNFNLPFISNGVKASTTLSEQYKKEYRKYGLIYSGIYNSISGINNLNQFIAAEKITKDINPIYGSIQKLHSRDTDLVTLCEDKCLRILANKDAVFNADGNPQLTANENVLGQTIPFVGEYGISKNPESFASESYRAYFTDKQRGAVLRLSKDGLTPISMHGMKDWFRDHLKLSNKLIGSYDDRQEEYNISVRDYGAVVSFKEDVTGWVSFKSFVQMENGISMANDYYTFYEGSLHQHHYGGDNATSYNTFYGFEAPSTFKVLLNEDPSTVKSYQTLSYEGSQAKVTPIDDDGQYYNLNSVKGWYLNNIMTDLEVGGAVEFIEKEGKWFNHIKGSCNTPPNSNDFSYQGLLSNPTTITWPPIYGCMDNTTVGGLFLGGCNYDPLANIDDGSCTYCNGGNAITILNYNVINDDTVEFNIELDLNFLPTTVTVETSQNFGGWSAHPNLTVTGQYETITVTNLQVEWDYRLRLRGICDTCVSPEIITEPFNTNLGVIDCNNSALADFWVWQNPTLAWPFANGILSINLDIIPYQQTYYELIYVSHPTLTTGTEGDVMGGNIGSSPLNPSGTWQGNYGINFSNLPEGNYQINVWWGVPAEGVEYYEMDVNDMQCSTSATINLPI